MGDRGTALREVDVGDVAGLLEAIPAFCLRQASRCRERGVDVSKYPLSHVALRARSWRDYLTWRDALEPQCTGALENVWNGRPISKLVLATPVAVDGPHTVPLLELIAPFHQRVYRMGLEHVGYVVGDAVAVFGQRFREVLTGQQFQGLVSSPYYILFPDDYTHVKFYRWSLMDVCLREGSSFDSFEHVTWNPPDPDAGPYEVL